MSSAAARAWQGFLQESLTWPNAVHDFPDWHRGRPRYALWAIDLVSQPHLLPRLEAAQSALADLLLPGYCRQPHITLHVCGFPAPSPGHGDDYDVSRFAAQVAALQQAGVAPFSLQVGGLGSFATAPFLTVSGADGELARLRGALAVAGSEWREVPYLPHVTVGLYSAAHAVATVSARREALVAAPPLRIEVRRIALMAYASPVIGGPLETLCEFDLADNLLRGEPSCFPPTTP